MLSLSERRSTNTFQAPGPDTRMETIHFDDLELDEVEQAADGARWMAGFPFSPDRPGETTMTASEYTVVYNELAAGDHIGRHRDAVDELLVVLEGTIEASVGEETHSVEAGTLAVIPGATDHEVRNVGSETARLLGIFADAPVDSTFESVPYPTSEE